MRFMLKKLNFFHFYLFKIKIIGMISDYYDENKQEEYALAMRIFWRFFNLEKIAYLSFVPISDWYPMIYSKSCVLEAWK